MIDSKGEVAAIELSEMAEAVNAALEDNTPCVLATASKDGVPDIGFKGSMMVFDNDHLAYWERSRGQHLDNVRENPRVAVLYRNSERGRLHWRFYGEAELHADGDLRETIMGRVVQRELDSDPERKGIAVVVRVDRVFSSRQLIQERKA